jgi:maltooligosyltrehalose trehalohydrolase
VTTLRVWAPRADRVAARVPGGLVGLHPEDRGWWAGDVGELRHGDDYAFVLDDGPRRPDPRSRWQPDGVDGPSRRYDEDRFRWTDAGWRGLHLPSAVIYEAHVGTFSPEGTFDGMIDRLDHLVELGVTALQLMPVAQASGTRGWGYDGVGLFAAHHAYGGPDGFKRLVDACHGRGLAVILGVVYNHLGPEGNHLAWFGPYLSERHHTPWGQALNFDGPGSDEVRGFVVDSACAWLRDHHVDALKLDAVQWMADGSATHILEELAIAVEELSHHLGRPLALIAESDQNDPRLCRRREVGGYGIDAQWSDDYHHALHTALTGERTGYYVDYRGLEDVAAVLRDAWVRPGEWSQHRGRRHGRPHGGLPGHRFVTYGQNHDQIGNRAQGERLSALVGPGRVRMAAALLLTSPFVPLLFQGEEWAAGTPFLYFTDHQDPELGRAVRQGRRSEFQAFGWKPEDVPDPQDPATFARSVLDWAELDRPGHAEVAEWYRALLRLRAATPALRDGRLDRVRTHLGPDRTWLVVLRGPVTVAANLGGGVAEVELPEPRPGRLLLGSDAAVEVEADERGRAVRVRVPPDAVAVLG